MPLDPATSVGPTPPADPADPALECVFATT
jgi:hypothetical protein